ncbi:hypothetical protein T4D_14490 [Trichinella pseudospiralis]|uniref:Uncharacterized protein n=1 Tax=Trichinella pseudospiralis TaxID=6337 RepID=A0A0V1F5Z2_TRIPS|nr:hypothetical protein T4D_14490 [Trichinella pseudospiralis]
MLLYGSTVPAIPDAWPRLINWSRHVQMSAFMLTPAIFGIYWYLLRVPTL